MSNFEATLAHWQARPEQFSADHWQEFISQLAPISFTSATLEVDEALWGSFWQGDVIAPGYVLPALELAYLRATRLEQNFATAGPSEYLHTLQNTLNRSPAGVWAGHAGLTPVVCAAFVFSARFLIIWLANGVIVAGYRDTFGHAPGYKLLPLQTIAGNTETSAPQSPIEIPPDTLSDWATAWPNLAPAARLDRLIRAHRAYSHRQHTATGGHLQEWLAKHSQAF